MARTPADITQQLDNEYTDKLARTPEPDTSFFLGREDSTPINEHAPVVETLEERVTRTIGRLVFLPGQKLNLTRREYTILVHPSGNENENWDVHVSVNGRAYKLKRGVPYKVPHFVVAALADAVLDKFEPRMDVGTAGYDHTSEVSYGVLHQRLFRVQHMRYPFTILD